MTDIVPTIYEAVGITPPRVVNGVDQMSMDGVSMVYTFADANAKGRKTTQFFDIMGSRGIYHDGWFADTPGPRIPWVPGPPKGIATWNPENDVWELYNLDEDWSQSNDLAAKMPEKVAYMKTSSWWSRPGTRTCPSAEGFGRRYSIRRMDPPHLIANGPSADPLKGCRSLPHRRSGNSTTR